MSLLPLKKPTKLKLFSVPAFGVTVFILLMTIITAFLYAIGTVQGFMDSTQLLLLRLSVIWGALLAAASFYGLVLDIILFVRVGKLRSLGGASVYLLLGITGLAVLTIALSIITMAAGNVGEV
jgi:hypothetical protein